MLDTTQSPLARKSPLARYWGAAPHAIMTTGSVSVRELPFQGVIKLQCRDCSPQFLAASKTILGVDLPQTPNTRVGDSPACMWVAPNEWVIVTEANHDQELADKLSQHLAQTLGGANTATTVITDSRVALKIEGPDAANLIAKGCSLDLHPEKFSEGQCAVTLLEQVPMMLYPEGNPLSYILFLDRSYAAFVWDWLASALKEFNG